ncbi:GumC family protein [Rubellimicrobium aerolatum]|uniref:GumC family protein n=1 Tax=Rubellimicrobium aerolatum TaxID=490979 RepID=A0ABW0S9L0_9RHOB|nr:Wzz/FepE/Etk N-terminal domain-containing protein [Rubellimicrobium aerolatum]MBP1804931.1 uncharacterized protein involved in exopolysaccharide biosynthesis [Rubellimicrobium aerolatum]
MDLKFYLSVFLRRLPYVILLTVLGAVLGGTVAALLPPSYYTQARLAVESEQIPGDLAASTVQSPPLEQIQFITQRILSRERLIDLANRLDIYAPAPGEAPVQMAADDLVADLRERIQITTTGGGPGRTTREPVQPISVTVGFTAGTAQLSAAVTNEVVTLMLRENVEMRTQTAGQTLDFFNQEVDRLGQDLARKGAAIRAFQESNRDALPDSLEFRRGQLVAEQERLLQLQRDAAALRERRQQLVNLYEATGAVGFDAAGAALTPEQRQLQELRNQLSSALAVLSPTNPRVTVLQNQITALEAQVAATQGASVANSARAGMSAYEIQLADMDLQIRQLEEQQPAIEAGLAELQATIEATPANAITLADLQRDYENVSEQYDQAVARRAVAETGEMIETLSRGQRITVVEQAVPPERPQSPNRLLIAAGGLGGGLFLGLALVALLELSDRSIRRPVELTGKLGIVPFAALPLIRSRYDLRRRKMRIAVALALILVVLPGALWFIHSQIMPLNLVADRLLGRMTASLDPVLSNLG